MCQDPPLHLPCLETVALVMPTLRPGLNNDCTATKTTCGMYAPPSPSWIETTKGPDLEISLENSQKIEKISGKSEKKNTENLQKITNKIPINLFQ